MGSIDLELPAGHVRHFELVAAQPNPRVVEWVDSVDEERLFLSAITIGEVKRGVERLPDSKRKTALQMWLEDDLLIRFRDRILPVDTGAMLVWGRLMADLEQGQADASHRFFYHSTACVGAGLVTRNESDFLHSDIYGAQSWSEP